MSKLSQNPRSGSKRIRNPPPHLNQYVLGEEAVVVSLRSSPRQGRQASDGLTIGRMGDMTAYMWGLGNMEGQGGVETQ